MKRIRNKELIIRVPRTFNIIVIQWFGLCILMPTMFFLIPTIYSLLIGSYKDLLIGSLISFPALILSLSILYIPQKYLSHVFVDKQQNVIRILKKGSKEQFYRLDEIKNLYSQKTVHAFPGFRSYKLHIEKKDGEKIVLFNEDFVFSGDRWENFAKKLSSKTNKCIKIENKVRDIIEIDKEP